MGFHEVQEKANDIVQAVKESGILIGSKSGIAVPGVEVETGLGMNTLARKLEEEAERLKQSSLFRILFMGTFKNGKSTTINALMGGNLLPVGAAATTAVISQVVYGTNKEQVRLYRENNPVPELLTMQRFLQDYRLTDEDISIIEEEGFTDRFSDVDCVVLESDLPLFRDGVQLIDSPGLGEQISRTKTTNRYVPQANAIVFLLDAQHPFGLDEKAFIRKHFISIDPKPRNVFFLINRYNQLNTDADRARIRQTTLNMLKGIFTGENGFDQNLYSKHVFFVNSYGALQAAINGIPDTDTQIPEFKQALEHFLTSEDRVLAKYRPVLGYLSSVYQNVEQERQENKKLLEKGYRKLEENQAKAEQTLDELENEVKKIKKMMDRSRDTIVNKVLNSLDSLVKVELLGNWPTYAEKYDERFGITDMIRLALPISDEEKNDLLRPMVQFVNSYIEKSLEAWAERVPILISSDIEDMQEELNDRGISFDIKLDQAKNIFSGSDSQVWQGGGANKLQLALSMIQGDVSVAVENSAGGNFSWGEFFNRYMVQFIINIIITSIVGVGPLGLVVLAVVEIAQMGLRTGATQTRLLNSFADRLFPQISDKLIEQGDVIREDLKTQFDKRRDSVTSTAYSLISDERNRQNEIIRQAKLAQDDIEAEQKRQKLLQEALFARLNLIFNLLYNRELKREDIKSLAEAASTDDSV